ncbi:glycosyltransferase family 4 protein [Lampropedia puyangensis]|uniref:Glycosyltransferase family 4 protein n=1 Tax=Lampropedia puyangensis TaxID=1330072 RepID=A0A4S8F910_9BURK|nr:glycosyltransferase family 4 protein [Lampropedia puyangensis]THU03709.1 glycosyltransferase family 4 protein [Lampropedia puyangensis]
MRIAFICKRRYMGKDVILDRYARLYEIPRQLALLGHEVHGYCLDYHDSGASQPQQEWQHNAAPGSLAWESSSLGRLKLPALTTYPRQLLQRLRQFQPDVLIGASDIPHVALAQWLATRLRIPYVVDLYDNFEGFGQARIPGFVTALRHATRKAALVTTTSEPLRQLVVEDYKAEGTVISMPSSVDLQVFHPGDKAQARQRLGLPLDAPLIGTAGGLYKDKGVEPLYAAWQKIASQRPDVHLVLAGPFKPELPPPQGERVHYLSQLVHAQVADLFRALDVGIISILDTPFGRYCFPQKAYEMLACHLRVVVADVGEMSDLFAQTPEVLFAAGNADEMVEALGNQLSQPTSTQTISVKDWQSLIAQIAAPLMGIGSADQEPQ